VKTSQDFAHPHYDLGELRQIAAIYGWMKDPNRPPLPENPQERAAFFASRQPEHLEDAFPGWQAITPEHVQAIWAGQDPFVGDLEGIANRAWWQEALRFVGTPWRMRAEQQAGEKQHDLSVARKDPAFQTGYWEEHGKLAALPAEDEAIRRQGSGGGIVRTLGEAEELRKEHRPGYFESSIPGTWQGPRDTESLEALGAAERREWGNRTDVLYRQNQQRINAEIQRRVEGLQGAEAAAKEAAEEGHPSRYHRVDPLTGKPIQ